MSKYNFLTLIAIGQWLISCTSVEISETLCETTCKYTRWTRLCKYQLRCDSYNSPAAVSQRGRLHTRQSTSHPLGKGRAGVVLFPTNTTCPSTLPQSALIIYLFPTLRIKCYEIQKINNNNNRQIVQKCKI